MALGFRGLGFGGFGGFGQEAAPTPPVAGEQGADASKGCFGLEK